MNLPISNLFTKLTTDSIDGYTTDDIVYLWKEGDPIQITRTLNIPDFTLFGYTSDYCTSRTNTGKEYWLF